jgi:hypothetical protein
MANTLPHFDRTDFFNLSRFIKFCLDQRFRLKSDCEDLYNFVNLNRSVTQTLL